MILNITTYEEESGVDGGVNKVGGALCTYLEVCVDACNFFFWGMFSVKTGTASYCTLVVALVLAVLRY